MNVERDDSRDIEQSVFLESSGSESEKSDCIGLQRPQFLL